jgi:uncharacterized protein YdhG (YjbR/CyaY superfamily)
MVVVCKEQTMHPEILQYHHALLADHQRVCEALAREIDAALPDAQSKLWHAHPVWFLEGNPIVGYSQQKPGIRLMFWSGADFDEAPLNVLGKKFRDASIFYKVLADLNLDDLRRFLRKARDIQWDYQNIIRRKGLLQRLK